ncbi:MAG: glycine--tRNA ligase [Candidatus Azambacteria bacterium]|nr:glycine--tRNA ligase [Candidatus Azambacteria bacterium]
MSKENTKNDSLMDKIVSLAKRRGFIFPGSEIYGGLANSWDYGPLGVELKNNIKQLWWKKFVQNRDDIVGIDSALIMNPKVWEASEHVATFNDPLVECKKCHVRYRADQNIKKCEECGGKELTQAKQFNLMFKTNLGPVEDEKSAVYLRPETAQGMFVNFKTVLDTSRKNIPFGIAQIGKVFRNEITPGNFIFRTREFEQMEIEYFINPKDDWNKHFEYWLEQMKDWLKEIGVTENLEFVEIKEDERAHYSKRTVDIEYKYPFGQKELYGLAYRGDFDLINHQKSSGQSLEYSDPKTGEKFVPHVIEPTWGVDRSVLVVLLEAYSEEKDRVVLKLNPKLASYKAAVFPLLANKPELVNKAKDIHDKLKQNFMVAFDDRGNIGKRYYAQDEIGTPFCITVDFESLENDTVTVRDRDSMKQERVASQELLAYLENKLNV